MPTTLLAVDDSVTMRKVLEITFAGEDFRVVTAENPDAALKKARAEKPQIALVDVTLPEMDGYALCRTLKSENPGCLVVILSSKQGPYDAGRGASVGADDFIDKPFDTQQLIEKVKKIATAKPAVPQGAAAAPPAARPPAPSAPEKVSGTLPGGAPPMAARPPIPAPGAGLKTTAPFPAQPPKPAIPAPTPATGVQRPPAPSAPTIAKPAAPQPAAAAPVAAPPAAATPTPSPAAPVAAAAMGDMGEKLAGLGLSPQQADAVMALSREVVERVVWEVVPQLAETMIKEEIKRLMAEG